MRTDDVGLPLWIDTDEVFRDDAVGRAVELLRLLPQHYSERFGRIADEFVQGAVDACVADGAPRGGHATVSVSVDDLLSLATGLRALAQQFRYRATFFAADISAADTCVTDVDAAWNAPRSQQNVGVARDYVDAVRGMAEGLGDVASKLDAFASDAEDIAGWLEPYEATLSADRDEVDPRD